VDFVDRLNEIGERLTDPSSGEFVAWVVRPKDLDQTASPPQLNEGPCPMCGRTCGHARLSVDDLQAVR